MPENRKHRGNYEGTRHMKAENQDMEFVNDTIQTGTDKGAIKEGQKKKETE